MRLGRISKMHGLGTDPRQTAEDRGMPAQGRRRGGRGDLIGESTGKAVEVLGAYCTG